MKAGLAPMERTRQVRRPKVVQGSQCTSLATARCIGTESVDRALYRGIKLMLCGQTYLVHSQSGTYTPFHCVRVCFERTIRCLRMWIADVRVQVIDFVRSLVHQHTCSDSILHFPGSLT